MDRVVHGRSSFVESFVWFLPFLCALGKRREKRKEEREKRKKKKRKRKEEKEKEKEKRGKRRRKQEEKKKERRRRREKKKMCPSNIAQNQKIHRTNCHIMIRKKPSGMNYLAFFFESSEFHFFSISSMIRIRFSGSGELNWKAFSRAR